MRTGHLVLGAGLLSSLCGLARAQVWNIENDYTLSSNPNGAWTFGRTWTANGDSIDAFGAHWGCCGWYLGDAIYSPSITQLPPVLVWPDDNSSGFADVRWTAPVTGTYSVDLSFTGQDSRGVDVMGTISVNGQTIFESRVSYGHTAAMPVQDLALDAGDHIDMVVRFVGPSYFNGNWTQISATILHPCAPADLNHDGVVDFFDYLVFVEAMDANDPVADFNGDNAVDFFDYLDFVAALDLGCE